jgi:hypothetical protein
MPASPRYPSLTPTALGISLSLLGGRRRSFRRDAQDYVRRLRPPLRVEGSPPPLSPAGRLILANHYWSPGFRAWWIPMALTAALDEDIHWVMTAAWTFPDPLRAGLLTPLTRRLFGRVARTYGFTVMPPMPPSPQEAAERAAAVREVVRYAASRPGPRIGLVPEGGDSPNGRLAPPPPGVGRFISLLAARGLDLLPAGVFEAEGALWVRFGTPILGPLDSRESPEARDRAAADRIMQAIAACLPDPLRGPYSRRSEP